MPSSNNGAAPESIAPTSAVAAVRERVSRKPTLQQRQSSTFKYHTFPTAPPRHQGEPTSRGGMKRNASNASPIQQSPSPRSQSADSSHDTPLPVKQLLILAVIALAEQTALNSISPYLPEMVRSFPEVREDQGALYVGLIASAFAATQFATGVLYGALSDRIGRKPVVLFGTICTAGAFVAFGFSKTLWQAVLVQAIMGLVNGNQGVISTCLGEITDRSNQGKAFTYLPVIYGLGGITGPVLGGLLVTKMDPFNPAKKAKYPYLLPNLVSAGLLVVDFIITALFLEESLEGAKNLPPFYRRVGDMFSWLWQFNSSSNPTYVRRKQDDPARQSLIPRASQEDIQEEDEDESTLQDKSHEKVDYKEIMTKNTILLMVTFLIFQLSNVSFNGLYPVFAQAPTPTGRALNPEEIGLSLAFAGGITIVFQVGIFGRLRERMGNKVTYRASLIGFALAFVLVPWVGYKNSSGKAGDPITTTGEVLLWIELGVVLIVKTIASVAGLAAALLLITNSAPSHNTLGTLNGIAQTLSAAGRAAGPLISGALYTAAIKVQPKGEALAFGIFGIVAFIGAILSLGITGDQLEDDDFEHDSDDDVEATSGDQTSRGR
ncbi:hypothetical protein AMS68_006382 [Peltaster fructicola]|uniref:Major facilitator superfamily (MFS) profile domain-containing protein n=1 Tax=Peltaster fructicola TaxID=286661 RepID=A0A6H0Y1S2_9PEZI|nr:hypothetical protein AMS68_006382 [Peltaster fructicola]